MVRPAARRAGHAAARRHRPHPAGADGRADRGRRRPRGALGLLGRLPPRRRVHAAAALGAGEDGRRDHPRRPTARASRAPTCTSSPIPNIPTSETGTRHRTAERVGRQIDVPVITVSEDMSVVAIHRRGEKHTLEPIPRVLARADQALQILGRYKSRLDAVSGSLSALEVEDLVTVRDVATVLQRAEMVRRIAEEIEGYVIELGADGRLVLLQLEELIGGVEDDRRLVAKDYFQSSADFELLDVHARARRSSTTRTLLDLEPGRGGAAPRSRASASTARCSRAASGCCTRSRACPRLVSDHVVERFANLQKIMRAGARRPRRGRRRRRGARPRDQGRPVAPRRDLDPRALRLSMATSSAGAVAGTRRTDEVDVEHITLKGRRRHARSTPIHARPDGMPDRGLVAAPRHHGRAAAVRRPVPPPRDARVRGVRARAVRARAGRGAVGPDTDARAWAT